MTHKEFSPLLVTTPRTGSSIICYYLAQIGKQTANYQNNLYEYFDVAPWNNLKYKVFKHFGNNILGLETNQSVVKLEKNNSDYFTSIEYKFNLLKENKFKYMIKIIPYDMDKEIIEYCHKKYDFVYLERRDKLKQLFSFMAMLNTNTSHYEKNSTEIVKKFEFKVDALKILDKVYSDYNSIKNSYHGPVLYYEDIFKDNFEFKFFIESLNIDQSLNLDSIVQSTTRPTIYDNINLENLISNYDKYIEFKPFIMDTIANW